MKFHDILMEQMTVKKRNDEQKTEKNVISRQELLERMSSKKGLIWIEVKSA